MNINHNLSCRSDHSIGKSLLQVDHVIDQAVKFGYESVCLMDEMSLNALPDFFSKAKKAGIKPIMGCHIRVFDDPTYRKPLKDSGEDEKPNPFYMLKVYVLNEAGLKSLFKMLSKANTPEYFYYQSRVGLKDILELEGVAVSTGDFYSVFHNSKYKEICEQLKERFDDKFFIELVPIDTPLFDSLNLKALEMAGDVVVTYPSLYRDNADAGSLEVLSAVTNNIQMDVGYRSKQYVKDFEFGEPKQIVRKCVDTAKRLAKFYGKVDASRWADGLNNIEVLAGMCGYEFKKMEPCLPKMSENDFMALGKLCVDGWVKRLSEPVSGYMPTHDLLPIYEKRLKYELGVLKKLNFCGYFLLVADIVGWAKSNDIMCGPGRGSCSGSLVSYLTGITDIDPIRFNLIFERFINPDRLDLPDADLDFMSSKRHLIVEYITNKYGKEYVAGVSNYSTLASASALRDTGRVFGLSGLDLIVTKLVPKEQGFSSTLTDAANAVPDLDKFKNSRPEIWSHALKLEGAMRSLGQHAAGIVVAGEKLINRCVVETRTLSPVVSWDKWNVEDFGLIKLDSLGLATLDILDIAAKHIKVRHGKTIDYLKIPLDDFKTLDAFSKGDTTGSFQFSSGGIRQLLKDLGKNGTLTFDDIAAATALYRPGPMESGMMAEYVQCKQGNKKPFYLHPSLEECLGKTYGVQVFQEGTMDVARKFAGYTMTEADFLRKLIGKKQIDKMAGEHEKFVNGAILTSGVSKIDAETIWDQIETNAKYQFNASHAYAYGMLSYWTVYIRVHYAAEYFAACMSVQDEDKVTELIVDARKCGIEVMPPDINISESNYVIADDNTLYAPFSAVKGVSETTALKIVELRKKRGGRYSVASDFSEDAAERGSKVNARVVSNLNEIGALASITPGSLPARHIDRRKIQMELLPGLVIDAVKADRSTDVGDKFLKAKVIQVVSDYRSCNDCNLSGQMHPSVRMSKNNVKYMVVFDSPSWEEEKSGKLMDGKGGDVVRATMKDSGVVVADGYFTCVVKSKKDDKFLSNQQINGCSKFLDREIALIKPPVIVALGSAAIRRFLPDVKPGEVLGKSVYSQSLDAVIVCGPSPGAVIFDPSKIEVLTDVWKKVAEILE